MAKSGKWYLGQDELLVNPPVPPKNGVWMEIDESKLRKKGPKLVTNCAECAEKERHVRMRDRRIVELEAKLSNCRAKLRQALSVSD
jgi:hypothetical protein